MKQQLSHSRWILIAAAVILILILVIADPNALWIILSVPLVLFLPGFAMTLILFSRERLGIPERLLLSIGLSIAFVALSSLILNLTPWGLQTTTLGATLFLILAVEFLVIYLIRRTWWKDGIKFPPAPSLNFNTRQWILMSLAAFMTVMAIGMARMPSPQTGLEGYTLLSAQAADTPNTIRLGVSSKEFTTTKYQIRLEVKGTIRKGPSMELEPGESWEGLIHVPSGKLAGYPLTIRLYRLDHPNKVYRHVVWWPE